jgi:hypothetical protein
MNAQGGNYNDCGGPFPWRFIRQVRERAYDLWLTAGRPEGGEAQFWLQAETELSGHVAREVADSVDLLKQDLEQCRRRLALALQTEADLRTQRLECDGRHNTLIESHAQLSQQYDQCRDELQRYAYALWTAWTALILGGAVVIALSIWGR